MNRPAMIATNNPTPELEPVADIKAIAWVIPGADQCHDNGWVDCMAWQDGEFSKPLCSLSEAAATIARLTAERDKWRDAWMKSSHEEAEAYRERDEAIERAEAAEASNKLLSERVAVLEGALEPFQKAVYWTGDGDVPPDNFLIDEVDEWRHTPTVGDFRRARAAREGK